jgi:AraC-like DNA-binding protein
MIIELVENIINIAATGNSMPISPVHIKQQVVSIQRAKEYMAAHLCESISLYDLSRYCYVSPFHFSRVFKKFTGYSPYYYLQMLRLKNAEILLKTTRFTISDVGFKSGFNSPDYFCAAFTKAYKMSPSRYKNVLA